MRIRSVFTHSVQALAEGALIALLVVGLMAGTTFAARGGGGGGGGGKPGGGGTTGGGTLALVLLNSTDGTAHYGQQVNFTVTTTATYPYVRLNCYENNVWVMTDSTGFYASYPWPGHIFSLRWDAYHTAGAGADCSANLYNGASSTSSLAGLSFHVYP